MVKNLPAMCETWVQSLGWEDPLEEGMATHSSILAWTTHGQRNLEGYCPWGSEESDTTEQLSTHTHTLCLIVGATFRKEHSSLLFALKVYHSEGSQ